MKHAQVRRRRRPVLRAVGGIFLTLVTAGGAYLTLDALDIVPGFLTVSEHVDPPKPFPTFSAQPLPASGDAGLGLLSDEAPVPSSDEVSVALAALLADARVGPHVGVLVTDALTGEVVASHGASGAFTPASTAKIVTAFGALSLVDHDARLATTVVSSGSDIVLVGGGDIMLAAGSGTPEAVNGHAGLADLAASTASYLTERNITTVALGLDDSFFTGPTIAPDQHPGNVPGGYIAPVTALAINIGKVTEGAYPPRWQDPSMQAAEVFAAALRERGITVTSVARTVAAPNATEIARVESATIAEITEFFMHTSDNTVTEAMCRIVASQTGFSTDFAGSTAAVLDAVAKVGIETAGSHLSDCSGLAENSVLTPTLLVGILKHALDPQLPQLRVLANSLPIAALEGTLAGRYIATDGAGTVRAKTGSLPGVTSLAGMILTDDERLLVFAVIADQSIGGGPTRAAIDKFIATLAGCGC